MANNKQRLLEVMQKVNPDFKPKLNEELAVASDGGYYDKPEHKIKVTSQEAAHIKQITDTMFNDLFGKDGVTKVSSNDGLKQEIIRGLKSSGIQMDYDTQEPNEDIYWIANQNDLERAKEEFKLIVSNLYDGVEDEPMTEGRPAQVINPKYTHFAVMKDTNEIVNGWDYNGVEPQELKSFKKDYFFNDLSEMGIDPHNIKVVTTKYLQSSGINPFDMTNWKQSVNEVSLNYNDLHGFENYSQAEKDLFGTVMGLVQQDSRMKEIFPDGASLDNIAQKFYSNSHHNLYDVLKAYAGTATNPIKLYNGIMSFLLKSEGVSESTMEENRDGFKRMIVYWLYDKEGGYLGDLDPMDEENNYISTIDDLVATPEFEKFAKEKNITSDQIGRVTKEREYTMNGNPLEKEHYAPSQSEELFDPKTNTWYNLSGQQMRDPSEYDRGGEGYTPFGDEGDDY